MLVALAGLAGAALAAEDVATVDVVGTSVARSEPSLATRLKFGLRAGIQDRGTVQIVKVQLYESARRLSIPELDRRLQAEEWLPVGILETKDHGRLRVTCHLDACVGEAGTTRVKLALLMDPPPPRAKRSGRPASRHAE